MRVSIHRRRLAFAGAQWEPDAGEEFWKAARRHNNRTGKIMRAEYLLSDGKWEYDGYEYQLRVVPD